MTSVRSGVDWLILAVVVFTTCPAVASGAETLPNETIAENAGEIALVTIDSYTSQSAGDELRRLFDLYRDARAAGMLDEADTIAKQIVESSIEHFGFDNKNTANALGNLATVQMSNDENDAAILNFSAAIGILERIDGRLSMDLFNPLRGMGSAQMQAGNPDLAKAFWERAVHISHVNLGPHNFEQVETLHEIARVIASDGKRKQINRMRRRLEYLYARDAERGFDEEALVSSHRAASVEEIEVKDD